MKKALAILMLVGVLTGCSHTKTPFDLQYDSTLATIDSINVADENSYLRDSIRAQSQLDALYSDIEWWNGSYAYQLEHYYNLVNRADKVNQRRYEFINGELQKAIKDYEKSKTAYDKARRDSR